MLWKVPGALLIQFNHDFHISKSNKEVTDYYSTLLSTINFLARLQPSDDLEKLLLRNIVQSPWYG